MRTDEKVPEIETGYYFLEKNNQGVATMTKMVVPINTKRNLPLPHSGSEYVSFKDINPQKDQPS